MTSHVMIDAGPALNFCSINEQRLLIAVTGPLSAPQTVSDEVLRNATDPDDLRFRSSEKVWKTLKGSRWLTILADDPRNVALVEVLSRVGGRPADLRKRMAKDLGERMVIAHASVMVQSGLNVTVLVDDGGGQKLVEDEQSYLRRHPAGRSFGNLYRLTTPDVLIRAIGTKHMPDRQRMRHVYSRLTPLDNGLTRPIERTDLLTHPNWDRSSF